MSTEPGDITDEQWMERLQAGEDHALNELMRRWEMPTKRFVYRLLGNTAESEDIAQDVFVRIYEKRGSYRPGARFSGWLFTIAANLARNRLRWWKRRPSLSLGEWIEGGFDQEDESLSPAARTQAEAAKERIAAVRAAIAKLSIDERTALVLFEYEEKSMAEIAEIEDCTAKAVENRLYRARKNLARLLRLTVDEAKLQGGG